MTTGLFSLLLLITLAHATLQDDRLAAAKVWQLRSANSAAMNLAYSDTYTTPDVAHTIRDVGEYGPREVALEYDNLVLDLAVFVGYEPYVLRTYWDPSTTQWIDANTLRVDYTLDLKTGFDPVARVYTVDGKGFRDTEFIVFQPGTAKITLGYTIQDPAAIKAIATQDAVTSNQYICNDVIFPACNGTAANPRPYLANTGFTTVQACVNFLNSLPKPNPCPFVRKSNTPDCRLLHGFSSFFLPQIHCAHVRPVSDVCKNECLPACANCDANAECIADFPTLLDPVFKCKCKNGYIGNGTSCSPKPCVNAGCPSAWGTYNCSSQGLCTCKPGFDTNPQANFTNGSNLCTCPPGQQNVTTSSGVTCIPPGRCIDASWQCTRQAYSQVKCVNPGNTFTSLNACICNYGFEGGWEYPCVCPAGKRSLWSSSINGEACLSSSECTDGWHCPYGQSCQVNSTSVIGRCVA